MGMESVGDGDGHGHGDGGGLLLTVCCISVEDRADSRRSIHDTRAKPSHWRPCQSHVQLK